jgi:hypothetical protein
MIGIINKNGNFRTCLDMTYAESLYPNNIYVELTGTYQIEE